MKITIKTFQGLSLTELYSLLQLRSQVFVVEQACVYQDIDGLDSKAYHLLGFEEEELVAYTRVFKIDEHFEKTTIGRVVVSDKKRMLGYGKLIMEATLDFIEKQLYQKTVQLSAQTYLIRFYNELGFSIEGEPYDEDGIEHIKMVRKIG